MKKSVIDLTAQELEEAAGEAWRAAAEDALAKGLPVTGSRNGRRFRRYPNGRIEDLGPVTPLSRENASATDKKEKRQFSAA